MAFLIDKQTLNDLNIFGKTGRNSVYELFHKTRTRGGAQLLEEMFLYPLSDAERIAERSTIIGYFQKIQATFPLRGDIFDALEPYLENTDSRTRILAENDTLQRKLKSYMGADTGYELLHKGILAAIELFNLLDGFLASPDVSSCPGYEKDLAEMRELLDDPRLKWVYEEKNTRRLDYSCSARYDNLLRYVLRDKIERLLNLVYRLDVYTSVAETAERCHFVAAQVIKCSSNLIHIEGMYHPFLQNPVANDLEITPDSNFVFLTGANMAGKSTFMKTFGICIYLAHLGFPVPAVKMRFSVQGGLFTTINLPDNLNRGYSHFYAEVLRLKKVAQEVGRLQHLVVIFDELFRGTNVKDAYDATVAVAEAFAEKRNCTFLISTHIIEAGEALKERCDNLNFVYLPTRLEGSKPVYTYKLARGITSDRHGMMIIRNEKIIDILRQ